MNKKFILLYLGVLCLTIVPPGAMAQNKTTNWQATHWVHSSRNCHHLLSAPAQCKWDFFEIKDVLEGSVIAWDQVKKDDKSPFSASVAILQAKNETVRVLLPGNYSIFKPGQHIKIAAGKEPESDVVVPLDRDYYLNEEKKGAKPVCRINSYDDKVLKTTWGRVVND